MKIIVAMDSFKGSISSVDLVDLIGNRIERMIPESEVYRIPIADGGEGTLDAFASLGFYKRINLEVHDPLMRKINSSYLIKNNDLAIVEMANSGGLTLLKDEDRNPLETTTFGLGETVKDALDRGIKSFIIGIGGSATNDGGIGMLSALGMKFFDKDNNLLPAIGSSLNLIASLDDSDFDKRIMMSKFLIASDVDNPLTGPNGATYVYGPQKGADESMVVSLDSGLENFSKIVKSKYDKDYSNVPGAGAAGGLGYALMSFFNGKLTSGIEIVFEHLNLDKIASTSDLIITGEGRIDVQSKMGKVLSGVGRLGKKYSIPVIAIAGSIANDIDNLNDIGITSIFSIINEPMDLQRAMSLNQTTSMLKRTIDSICSLIKQIKKSL
jgi:glycerate kinase